jgi:hypothetical protein
LATALPSLTLYAQDYHTLQTPQGQPIFEIRFFDLGDGAYTNDSGTKRYSTWTMNAEQKKRFSKGLDTGRELSIHSQGSYL